jgi:hypothetical protein
LTAAWALGLGGAGRVLGRLFYAPLARRTSVRGRAVAVLLAGAAGTALLGVVSGPLRLVAIAVVGRAVRRLPRRLHRVGRAYRRRGVLVALTDTELARAHR